MGKQSLNLKLVIKLLGILLFLESFAMSVSGLVAWFYGGDDVKWFALSIVITTFCGLVFYLTGKKADLVYIGKREGYFFVTFVWVLFSLFGMLPFYLGGYIPTITDAYFETMSGFTTTGTTVMTQIEIMPHGILFWRSLTQWLGGTGVIMLSLAIMPLLNMDNPHSFAAEVQGQTVDKLQPRIISTARIVCFLYIVITLIETILLNLAGMNLFDAVCHAFTSMATGGFSTKDSSIGWFNSPTIEYILIAFMFIAGTNFLLIFWTSTGKLKLLAASREESPIPKRNPVFCSLTPPQAAGNALAEFKKMHHNDEFIGYLFIVLIASAVLTFGLWYSEGFQLPDAIRTALFHIVSFMTTTGYTTTVYGNWVPLLWGMFLLIMLIGGMSGSTAGGLKVARVIICLRHCTCELKKVIHPNAVFPVRYNGNNLHPSIVSAALGFMTLYFLLIFGGVAILMSQGIQLVDALGAVISCISNVGPGFGVFSQSFFALPDLSTWTLSFLMIAGRLEVITVLLLIMPDFWKK